MEFLSTLISLLSIAVLVAALLNPLRPLDDGVPGTRTSDKACRSLNPQRRHRPSTAPFKQQRRERI